MRIFRLVIGVTNQRETTILWDKNTGKPLHNALIWLDARTQETVDFLLKQYNKDKNCLQVSERFFLLLLSDVIQPVFLSRINVVYPFRPIFRH